MNTNGKQFSLQKLAAQPISHEQWGQIYQVVDQWLDLNEVLLDKQDMLRVLDNDGFKSGFSSITQEFFDEVAKFDHLALLLGVIVGREIEVVKPRTELTNYVMERITEMCDAYHVDYVSGDLMCAAHDLLALRSQEYIRHQLVNEYCNMGLRCNYPDNLFEEFGILEAYFIASIASMCIVDNGYNDWVAIKAQKATLMAAKR